MSLRSILVIPDTHVPYHDRASWELVLRVKSKLRPDGTVIIGDFADFWAVSSHTKDPARKASLRAEVRAVNRELDRLGRNVVFLGGNHEYRLERYLAERAPELFGLIDCPSLFRIRERGWKWVPYHQHYQLGKVLFTHDLGFSGKNASSQTLDAAGTCVVFGHTHRGGLAYGGTVRGEHRVAMNVGWLGDFSKIDYMHRAKTRHWQHGFGWITMNQKGLAWMQFCAIVGGKVVVNGTEFA